MATLYLWVLGPAAAGIAAAVLWWVARGRRAEAPVGGARWAALAAGLLVVLATVVARLVGIAPFLPVEVPSSLGPWYMDHQFSVPLATGVVGVVLLALPVRRRSGRGTAELARRSLVSFSRPRWFVAPSIVLGVILVITLATGAASERNPADGRYTQYTVDLGGERSMGTIIYGWFFSVPALVLIAVLVAAVLTGMHLVARAPLGVDRADDVRDRTVRTRAIVAGATGTLLVHLGMVFASVSSTSSMRSTHQTSEGPVSFWTTFSALQPLTTAASIVCAALGVALWTSIALSALPSVRRVRAAVPA